MVYTKRKNMGRVNKTIEGVFVDIVGTSTKHSSYDTFINNENGQKPSKELNEFVTNYKNIITKQKTVFEKLAKMEEIIMQLRTKENIKDIKLSLVREYIYARCSFYRNDKETKDIRVIVGTTGVWGENVQILLGNEKFMKLVKVNLIKVMEREINENIINFKMIYN